MGPDRAADPRPHVAVVDHDPMQRQLVADYLGRSFRISAVADGPALRRLLDRDPPALVLLGGGVPGEGGPALARWLRQASGQTGIVMVTASGATDDRIAGLEAGADDFVAKPFELRELLARVRTVLRRLGPARVEGPAPGAKPVRMGRHLFDLDRGVLVDPGGREEGLSASEYDLLKLFAENPNRALRREWMLEVLTHREADASGRSIDLRVTRLRRKIEADPSRPQAIRTVRGVGYVFVPPEG